MNKKRYFSIGEIANLTGVTIRTLQYYDNIGLIPLNKELTNGRRYYEEKDITKLQQVLFYKSLGLPIKEIKELVVEAVTVEQVTDVLQKQKQIFYQKLNDMKMSISLIDASLKNLERNQALISGELVQLMSTLNKDIIFEYKNVHYDEKTDDVLISHYEKTEEVIETYWKWKALVVEAVAHIINGVDPKDRQGQDFAKRWMEMVALVTGGRLELLEAHKVAYENRNQWPEEDRRLMEFADEFIDKSVESYLTVEKER
ncbi:MerR family transcriptional regulator [Terrisporobacter petrolearius]|uniref:MerR family transcriptional regulator n=1 Tax=Terrisporobacter petrolearius TaxID=1460447 RepID=UPI001D161F22|nr:MerR family transcriptional regulator [Terrisporobacter petrolearius]MCC3863738.1 MerR family transcriptional regulator [Terrisporobacter petrolearius]